MNGPGPSGAGATGNGPADVAGRDGCGLVATSGEPERIAGHGCCAGAAGALRRLLLRQAGVIAVDCNPVMVSESGALVVDARVRVGPAPAGAAVAERGRGASARGDPRPVDGARAAI